MMRYAKAIYGAVMLGLASLELALTDGVVSYEEAVKVIVATLGGFAVIWGVPNDPPSKGGTP